MYQLVPMYKYHWKVAAHVPFSLAFLNFLFIWKVGYLIIKLSSEEDTEAINSFKLLCPIRELLETYTSTRHIELKINSYLRYDHKNKNLIRQNAKVYFTS